MRWARYPLRCDLVSKDDDVTRLAVTRAGEFFAAPETEGEAAVVDARQWYLYVSEKIVAITQGRSFFTWEIHPGWWARRLSKHVVRTPYGIGLGDPTTMQLAIDEVGLGRILLAAGAALAGKAVGQRGVFYKVTGPAVRAIDGPTEYSAYPANVSAKLAPADPDGAAARISAAIRARLPRSATARFGGTVVIDANDLGTERSRPRHRSADRDLGGGVRRQPAGTGTATDTPGRRVLGLPRVGVGPSGRPRDHDQPRRTARSRRGMWCAVTPNPHHIRRLTVPHPEIFLNVDGPVALSVDRQEIQTIGYDVCAACRKGHTRPGFPLGDGARDGHRPWCGAQDGRTHALMRPDPRVDGQPVGDVSTSRIRPWAEAGSGASTWDEGARRRGRRRGGRRG